jgi:hypothetical protein
MIEQYFFPSLLFKRNVNIHFQNVQHDFYTIDTENIWVMSTGSKFRYLRYILFYEGNPKLRYIPRDVTEQGHNNHHLFDRAGGE